MTRIFLENERTKSAGRRGTASVNDEIQADSAAILNSVRKHRTNAAKRRGNEGEQKAAEFLRRSGYTIIERNWRTQSGEIDIIAEKDGVIVFAEVKTLPSGLPQTLEHVLGTTKQQKIIETAKCFLSKHRQYNNRLIRFDALVIDMPDFPPIYHIADAFSELT